MENLFTLPKKMITLVILLFLFACSSDDMTNSDLQSNSTALLSGKTNTDKLLVFKGPEVQFGYGKVRSWISVSQSGTPNEIGLEITPEAFKNLTDENDKKIPADHSTVIVPLHLKAKQLTPFNHIGLNWNPRGHIPEGVFDVPHFDIHFYMISIADQMAIPAWSQETDAAFNNYPPEGYMPADYFTPPGDATAEAQMGKHWLPVNLGAFLPFSKIMIYGSYNGKVIFTEPMITLDHLLSHVDSSTDYSQPQFFQKPGNYPTKYNIYHNPDNGNTYITLSGFVARE
ncbi:hypothetical protein SAMN05192550_3169 [Flavobacterium glycines]|uniref:Uncharacterized protein n=1 Tax=Flavobacterium glycines TaxID=551990 RepID=A0A1B9DX20_9FLAO|nr:DUF5602 domain-containing protein [Flavobacterium glycines]OCB74230.1 hypothetical protein FBGL_02150 [Flavobacterium glycines]GEL12260.1 hypothetical protein FGL01_29990 [Flavobacterium glycines]SDK01381.1 hypothetical protein SAMN05192550_3169 [Flavobacterium glycines]